MIEEEKRIQTEKKEQWDASKEEKLSTMLLFMACDKSDDGYIQIKEWMELKDCIVLNKTDKVLRPKTKIIHSNQAMSKRSLVLKKGVDQKEVGPPKESGKNEGEEEALEEQDYDFKKEDDLVKAFKNSNLMKVKKIETEAEEAISKLEKYKEEGYLMGYMAFE